MNPGDRAKYQLIMASRTSGKKASVIYGNKTIYNASEPPKNPPRQTAARDASNKKKTVTKRGVKKGGKKPSTKKTGPKRPPTAFFLFSADTRAAVKKANPSFKVTEVASELGKEWRNLSSDKRKAYITKAAAAKKGCAAKTSPRSPCSSPLPSPPQTYPLPSPPTSCLCRSPERLYGPRLVVLDFETTGLSEVDQVVQIGAVEIFVGVLKEHAHSIVGRRPVFDVFLTLLNTIDLPLVKVARSAPF